MAQTPTSFTVAQARATMNDWKFSPKKDYGPKEFGAKISYIRYKGQKIEMQFGVSPLDDPDSLDLLTTEWGITQYKSKEDKEKERKEKEAQEQQSRQPPPGVPGFQNWNGSVPPGSYPTPGNISAESEEKDSSVKKNTRRSLDITVQFESETKKLCDEADARVKQEALNYPQEWFSREKIGEEAVDMLYSSSVKKPADDQLPALNTKLNLKDLIVYLCDTDRNYTESDYTKVRKDIIFLVTVEISGVWFIKSKEQPVKNFGLAWNTKSILLFSTTARPKFNFQLGNTYTQSLTTVEEQKKEENLDVEGEQDPPAEDHRKRSFPFSSHSTPEPETNRVKVAPGSFVENPALQTGFPSN